jgi:phosphatidylglycerophosphate synthase
LAGSGGLNFKAYEIEELADVYFFRPLGMVAARAARRLRLTPTTVTIAGAIVGVVGGALLYNPDRALAGFALIIAHSILDSADGQLARMTGRVSELGRLLDGLGGLATHLAIYAAIVAALLARGTGLATIVPLAVTALLANLVHAQMYDYHRSAYARVVIKGDASRESHGFVGFYEAMESRLAGLHPKVEAAIAARSRQGKARDEDREQYRARFYWPVRAWNVLGDNTRFYAVGVLAWLRHLEWFFVFVLVPMNVALVIVWLWQVRADRRFLASL